MLGGPVIKQHVVEFVLGSGVKTDGILDSTSPNGPWTWVVPMGVAQIFATGCGAGSGGGGGTNNANSGGGGGGGSGMSFLDFPVDVVQNTSLQVTIGAKGIGGTPTVASTAGGDTTIEGVIMPIMTDTGSTLKFLGGAGGTTSNLSSGQAGQAGGKIHSGTAGGAATPTAGTTISTEFIPGTGGVNQSILIHALGGSGGGGASAGSGGNGGSYPSAAFISVMWTSFSEASATSPSQGIGNATRGGGGVGGNSLFGKGGNGGNGGSNGTNATGYGAGGGGGGGAANGGDGSDGYLRITYWSAD